MMIGAVPVRFSGQSVCLCAYRQEESLSALPIFFKCEILYRSLILAGRFCIFHIGWLFVNHSAKVRKNPRNFN